MISVSARSDFHSAVREIGQMMTNGYGSIPINTIFSGMNIHLPAILMFTRGTRVLTHCQMRICWPRNFDPVATTELMGCLKFLPDLRQRRVSMCLGTHKPS